MEDIRQIEADVRENYGVSVHIDPQWFSCISEPGVNTNREIAQFVSTHFPRMGHNCDRFSYLPLGNNAYRFKCDAFETTFHGWHRVVTQIYHLINQDLSELKKNGLTMWGVVEPLV